MFLFTWHLSKPQMIAEKIKWINELSTAAFHMYNLVCFQKQLKGNKSNKYNLKKNCLTHEKQPECDSESAHCK